MTDLSLPTSILEAASAGVKDMADGSLRITVEFSPIHAKEAYALFGARGTPLAITALKAGYAAAGGALKPQEQPKEKIGALCLLAVQWCEDEQFQVWAGVQDEESAKQFILATCACESRKELDENMQCGDTFDRDIRRPFMAYLKENQ